ncbi:MAG: palindromic element RPE1 domain-containing protein [Candidatus Cardinium sp.]|nr:MAG: palindromic element RPE1 domain-containing protein [Candidatus Cardinium sp.]
MENFLIPRRFVRIKALQNLYAYTISKVAHKNETIEQVKKDFTFDPFLHTPDQKEPLAKQQSIAVAAFTEAVAAAFPMQDFAYVGNKKMEQSSHFLHYLEALKKEETLLQNGFNQSKKSIYTGILYTLLLLVEWYKLAKATYNPAQPAAHLLKTHLAQDPLLEELYHNASWMNAMGKNGISWVKDQDQVQNWYRQFIETREVPKSYGADPNNNNRSLLKPICDEEFLGEAQSSTAAYSDVCEEHRQASTPKLPLEIEFQKRSSVELLEDMFQKIIFQEGPINDFLAMTDLYWDEHKRMVKKFLTRIFTMRFTQDFSAFMLFWDHPKWAIEEGFYNRLLTTVIQNDALYEAMIGQNAEKWDRERILLTDKLILKLALAELLNFKDIPFKVSINEYIEIAKWYGTSKSACFINGVLEGILKGLNK